MKFKLDRIISVATLVASLVAIILVLKRPATVPQPQAPAAIASHPEPVTQQAAQSGQAVQLPPPSTSSANPKPDPGQPSPQAAAPTSQAPKAEAQANINSDAISAMLAQSLGSAGGAANLTPDTNVGNGAPVIKDQQVSVDGDIVHGRFLTEIAGKDVWVTISGHMGQKDGYATFDPTEFKVGDMDVPVSLVNPALQRKLAQERDRLKVPDGDQQK